MSPIPYCNNLRKGDEVLIVSSGRRGVVKVDCEDKWIFAPILLPGLIRAKKIPIDDLRLLVDGKVVEDVPPCDGVPGPMVRPAQKFSNEAAQPAVLGEILAELKKISKAVETLAACTNASSQPLHLYVKGQ
jgi:hypothetical protein